MSKHAPFYTTVVSILDHTKIYGDLFFQWLMHNARRDGESLPKSAAVSGEGMNIKFTQR